MGFPTPVNLARLEPAFMYAPRTDLALAVDLSWNSGKYQRVRGDFPQTGKTRESEILQVAENRGFLAVNTGLLLSFAGSKTFVPGMNG
jgi:hypothetical protein